MNVENIQIIDIGEVAEQLLKVHPDYSAEGFSEYQNGRLNGLIEGMNFLLSSPEERKSMLNPA